MQQKFWDNSGTPHLTETDTNRAILTAMGYDCTTEASLPIPSPGRGGTAPPTAPAGDGGFTKRTRFDS